MRQDAIYSAYAGDADDHDGDDEDDQDGDEDGDSDGDGEDDDGVEWCSKPSSSSSPSSSSIGCYLLHTVQGVQFLGGIFGCSTGCSVPMARWQLCETPSVPKEHGRAKTELL